jgi:hypothetical protein
MLDLFLWGFAVWGFVVAGVELLGSGIDHIQPSAMQRVVADIGSATASLTKMMS